MVNLFFKVLSVKFARIFNIALNFIGSSCAVQEQTRSYTTEIQRQGKHKYELVHDEPLGWVSMDRH